MGLEIDEKENEDYVIASAHKTKVNRCQNKGQWILGVGDGDGALEGGGMVEGRNSNDKFRKIFFHQLVLFVKRIMEG